MVLVGHDGVQFPAIHFPSGGHLLSFLTCLEAGLQPKGRLDPPLGIQSGKGNKHNCIQQCRHILFEVKYNLERLEII